MKKHGLMSFIVHPDYVLKPRECGIYEALLDHLAFLRREKAVWTTTPGEVNLWWRQRAEMRLVENGDGLADRRFGQGESAPSLCERRRGAPRCPAGRVLRACELSRCKQA